MSNSNAWEQDSVEVFQLVAAAEEDPETPGEDPEPTEEPTASPGDDGTAGAGAEGTGSDETTDAVDPADDLPATGTPGPWTAALAAMLLVVMGLALRLRARASER